MKTHISFKHTHELEGSSLNEEYNLRWKVFKT